MNLEKLKTQFSDAILEAKLDKGQAVAQVKPEKIHDILKFCRDDEVFQLTSLMDVVGVDFLGQEPRFEIIYLLYSINKKHRLRIKVRVGENQTLATASDLFASADWAEREVYDMFGIKFTNHPNLKRILMYEGFEGHPLRKDYPMDKRQKIPEIEERL